VQPFSKLGHSNWRVSGVEEPRRSTARPSEGLRRKITLRRPHYGGRSHTNEKRKLPDIERRSKLPVVAVTRIGKNHLPANSGLQCPVELLQSDSPLLLETNVLGHSCFSPALAVTRPRFR